MVLLLPKSLLQLLLHRPLIARMLMLEFLFRLLSILDRKVAPYRRF
jgi:hypothetical protein